MMLTPPQDKEDDGRGPQPLAVQPPGHQGADDHGRNGRRQAAEAEEQHLPGVDALRQIHQQPEGVLPEEQTAHAALEFFIVGGGPLQIGHDEHVDAEKPRAHAREEGYRQHESPPVLLFGAVGFAAGGHLHAQGYHHHAQAGLEDPGHGVLQQQRPGNDAQEIGPQQRRDPPPLEAAAVFPGDPGVHRTVQQQRPRGDEDIVQPHGQKGPGDQGISKADETLDGVGDQLHRKDECNDPRGKFHGHPSFGHHHTTQAGKTGGFFEKSWIFSLTFALHPI